MSGRKVVILGTGAAIAIVDEIVSERLMLEAEIPLKIMADPLGEVAENMRLAAYELGRSVDELVCAVEHFGDAGAAQALSKRPYDNGHPRSYRKGRR